MSRETLAIKYRPKTFDDMTEQDEIKTILRNQLNNGTVKNAYLFCGPAGCGKTTSARIFANEINKGYGVPIELDAASNNSVDDVRHLIDMAQTKSLDSDYKIFIMDEVHALSNSAWQAMLKILEEPPKFSIFILCTTDPQKIPDTILSRVQRYDFQKISFEGIVKRLGIIIANEKLYSAKLDAVEYIAKLANGGMRNAITMLDKALAYSTDLTLENVVASIGEFSYTPMMNITTSLINQDIKFINVLDEVYNSGADLKLFNRKYIDFALELYKYAIIGECDLPNIPEINDFLRDIIGRNIIFVERLIKCLMNINNTIKWDKQPKTIIQAMLIGEML